MPFSHRVLTNAVRILKTERCNSDLLASPLIHAHIRLRIAAQTDEYYSQARCYPFFLKRKWEQEKEGKSTTHLDLNLRLYLLHERTLNILSTSLRISARMVFCRGLTINDLGNIIVCICAGSWGLLQKTFGTFEILPVPGGRTAANWMTFSVGINYRWWRGRAANTTGR